MKTKLLITVALVLAPLLQAADKPTVRVSLFSWPGYGFWFVAKEKNLAPDINLDIQIIEDPYESYAQMTAGQLDVTSSTAEYGPIAADAGTGVKMVTYTNPSTGTDKIIVAPGIENVADLKGKDVAVLEGGLTQIFMAMWLENNGLKFDDVKYVNVIMDDAVAAMVSGKVAAGEFWEPFGGQVLKSLKGSRVMATTAEPEWQKSGLLGDGMYMATAFLEKNPEVAKKAMKAYWDAVAYWKANPDEANKIIADAIKFEVSDVEDAIGKGTGAGIYVFDLPEAAKFMGVIPGEPPLGMANGQVQEQWKLTSDWWLKFGLIKKLHPIEAGVSFEPLKSLATAE
ncbi:MAG: ABC transporter substrate-binding protein [Terrimicrobiaceae bacterium]|nr:ABC transporter substrate-binding protein [Terrimicrobiaceae bacterium]